ncbi:MAG: DedA family protein [Bacteroidales bacterium]|nr:DedA family protein [Bacteroidales bacterium]
MISFLQQWGLLGLFVGTFLAATVVPFSSDALFLGVLAAGVSPWPCLIVATLGNWLGGLTSFGLGWLGRWEWIERWLHVKRATLERQQHKIDRFGPLLALLTWLPFVGDIFAVALGFYRLSPLKCALYMLVGKAARFLLWLLLFL